MIVLTAEEMKKTDRSASEDFGIPSGLLMEHAALSICKVIKKEYPNAKKIGFICGKGNNGGDGIAAARILKIAGYESSICLALGNENMSPLASMNLSIIKRASSIPILPLDTVINESDILVDAIFGTGFNGNISDDLAEMIEKINSLKKPVISVDIPSGLNADTGKVSNICIKANITVTFAYLKRCFFIYPGSELSGKIFLADIGIPDCANSECAIPDPILLSEWMPRRKRNDWKGSSGRIFILAGSDIYTGAAYLSCKAAMRSGCGMVYLAVLDSINSIMRSKLTEEIIIPYNENNIENIFEIANKCNAAIIGPGMGKSDLARYIISTFLEQTSIPTVIDADALYPEFLISSISSGRFVLTPHVGEMARLLNKSVEEISLNQIESAKEASSIFHSAVIMKGTNSITYLPEGYFYFNPTGSEVLATAGSGDVLSGIIGAMLARGCSTEEAAVLGNFIHGASGDIVSKKIGKEGAIASDFIECIPTVLDILHSKDYPAIEKLMKIEKIPII